MCNKVREGLIFSEAGGKMETNTIKYCTRAALGPLPTLTNPSAEVCRKHVEFSSVLPRAATPWRSLLPEIWLGTEGLVPVLHTNISPNCWQQEFNNLKFISSGIKCCDRTCGTTMLLRWSLWGFLLYIYILISPLNLPLLVLPVQSYFGAKLSRQLF